MPPSLLPQGLSQRAGYVLTGTTILLCTPLDLLMLGGWSLPGALTRLAWGGAFLVFAAIHPLLSPRTLNAGHTFAAMWSAVCFAALVSVSGGASSPLYAWHIAIPVAVATLAQANIRAVGASSGLSVLSAVLIGYQTLSAGELVVWVALILVAVVIALYGSLSFRAHQLAELEAEGQRSQAELKLIESQQRGASSERLVLVGQLSAGVAHEINNPLSYVAANLNFLRDVLREPASASAAEVEQACNEAIEGVTRIRGIVADLKSFARESTEFPDEVQVLAVVKEALRITRSRLTPIRIELAIPEDLPPVRASHPRLVQVFVNLLMNAADALEGARTASPQITVRARVAAGRVVAELEDNGPGIPADALPRVFQPFFTTKEPGKGTGLGLALSQEYLERFGGSLKAENAPGGGARFTLCIPQFT